MRVCVLCCVRMIQKEREIEGERGREEKEREREKKNESKGETNDPMINTKLLFFVTSL